MTKYKVRTEYHVRWKDCEDEDHHVIETTEAVARLFAMNVALDQVGMGSRMKFGSTVTLFEVDIMEVKLDSFNKASTTTRLQPPRLASENKDDLD